MGPNCIFVNRELKRGQDNWNFVPGEDVSADLDAPIEAELQLILCNQLQQTKNVLPFGTKVSHLPCMFTSWIHASTQRSSACEQATKN